jgi:restriction system protein
VNFKMAENSLFAILLRSSWWISAAVAGVFVLIARLLLPDEYFVFGAIGAFPFLVISALAARKQWQRPSVSQVVATRERVSTMSWPEFSAALEEAFRQDGYQVQRLNESDADLQLSKAGRITVAGCKRWKAARTGVEPLRALYLGCERRDAHDCLYIATGEVSTQARQFASAKRIRIVEADALTQLLRGRGLPKKT